MIQEKSGNSGNDRSVILFEIGWEQFAIDLVDVKEIVQAGQIRKLPKSMDFIEGIYNYRGDIIHIVNLKKKLKLEEYKLYRFKDSSNDENNGAKKKYIVILNVNNMLLGFLVDRILNISHIKANDIISLSPIFQTNVSIESINGIIKFKDRPRILLDLSNIFKQVENINIQNK